MGVVLQIDRMSKIERLQAIDELWNSLVSSNEELQSPSWHNDIVLKRVASIKTGTAKFISIDDIKKNSFGDLKGTAKELSDLTKPMYQLSNI